MIGRRRVADASNWNFDQLHNRQGTTLTNYEILGRRWIYPTSVEQVVHDSRKSDKTKIYMPNAEARAYEISFARFFPVLRHLGFKPISDNVVRSEVTWGIGCANEFFCEHWWRSELLTPESVIALGAAPQFVESLLEMTRQQVDKSRPDRELRWYDAFRSTLFLCGLADRWMDLSKICAWFDDTTIEPEYVAGTTEDQYQLLFLHIASSLNPNPPTGLEELMAKVKKSRMPRTKAMVAIWEAIQSKSQKEFDKGFVKVIDRFLTQEGGPLQEWADTDSSALLMLARKQGLAAPQLGAQQQAAIVTPESAGMRD